MKLTSFIYAVVAVGIMHGAQIALGQSIPEALIAPVSVTGPAGVGSPGRFAGTWTYRSFRSDPNLGTEPNRLLFGSGSMTLVISGDQVSGTLGGTGWQLNLTGSAKEGDPATIRFQGRGMIGGEEWVYDYLGYLVPAWPNGVNQRPAIVGSIVRTVPHSNGQARAGEVAQWIAVSADAAPAPAAPAAGLSRLQGMSMKSAPLMEAAASGPRSRLQQLWDDFVAGKPDPTPDTRLEAPQAQQLLMLKRALPENVQTPFLKNEEFLPERERESLAASSTLAFADPPEASEPAQNQPIKLEVRYSDPAQTKIGNDPVKLRSYNGQLVGPTIRCKRGEVLRIRLENRLPFEDPSNGLPHNEMRDFNVTNLHFHGLHVSPSGISDNVFLEVGPYQCQDYEVSIPDDHPCGTFWYHAHRHGSVAAQLASGMAGALIVEGGQDERLKVDHEEILVLQQIPYVNDVTPGNVGLVEKAYEDRMFSPPAWDALKRFTTVNGQRLPVFTVKPGTLLRWRFIDGAIRQPVFLNLVKQEAAETAQWPASIAMHEFAVDGLPLGKFRQINPNPDDGLSPEEKKKILPNLELHPGYRSDVLILVPSTAALGQGKKVSYYLVDQRNISNPGPDTPGEGRKYVARLDIVGEAATPARALPDVQLLDKRPDSIAASETEGRVKTMKYSISSGPVFQINGESYDENRGVTPKPVKGQADEWQVSSINAGPHPFHIHVNAFEIFSISRINPATGQLEEKITEPLWRDTVAMENGWTVKFRTKYEDFAGKFVQHCHILDHEDQGMMMNVEIVEPAMADAIGGGAAPMALALEAAQPRALPALPAALRPFAGKPFIAVVVRSLDCPLCLEQMEAFTNAATQRGWPRTVVVTPDSAARLQAYNDQGGLRNGTVVADSGNTILNFIDPAARAEDRRHALLVVDAAGKVVHRSAGVEPVLEPEALRSQVEAMGIAADPPQTAAATIEVRKTAVAEDDYIGWSPVLCTLRLPSAVTEDTLFTLTNDPVHATAQGRPRPSDGDVLFDEKLAPGVTATRETVTLLVPAQKDSVDFYIAGKYGRPSSEDKDCIIEIHQGGSDGPVIGTHALMVRVRKSVDDLEPKEVEALTLGMEALHVGGVNSVFERHVQFHGLAAGRNSGVYPWKDQAHIGPGFTPWHRAFLLSLERALQKEQPGIALPYWRLDKKATIFTQDFIGENAVATGSPDTDVLFTPGHPLEGWSLQLPDDLGNPLGALQRSARNRNQVPAFGAAAPFAPAEETHFQPPTYQGHWLRVEPTPHDRGHGWVGYWMGACTFSPGDPVFWLFHCDFDRLWAKWQYYQNRFKTDGSDPAHFAPVGSFDRNNPLPNPRIPGEMIPKGHYLNDTLWPWDGTAGSVQGGTDLEIRPEPNDFGQFPKSSIPGVWPKANASPKISDMIDYLGIDPERDPLGFSYDDVPYGSRPPEDVLALAENAAVHQAQLDQAADVLLDAALPQALKVKAARMVAGTPLDKKKADLVRATLLAPGTEDKEKIELVGALQHNPSAEARGIVIATLQSKQSTAVRVAAAEQLGQRLHTSAGEAEMKEISTALNKAADDTRLEVKLAAVQPLVAMGDKPAISRMTELLVSASAQSESADLRKVMSSFTAAGINDKTRPILEKSAQGSDEVLATSALRVLDSDKVSAKARLAVLQNQKKPVAIRIAALESLIHDPALTEAVLPLVQNKAEPSALRVRSIAALRANLRGRKDAATVAAPEPVLAALRKAAEEDSDANVQKAARANLRILEPKK